MSFLAAAGSIAAAEALAAAAMAGTTAAQVAAATLAAEAAAAAAAAAATEAAVVVPEVLVAGAETAAPEVVSEGAVEKVGQEVGKEGIKDLARAAEAPKSPEGGIGDVPVEKPAEPLNLENAYRGDPKGLANSEDVSAGLENQRIADAERLAKTQDLEGPFNNGTKIGRMVEVTPKEPPPPIGTTPPAGIPPAEPPPLEPSPMNGGRLPPEGMPKSAMEDSAKTFGDVGGKYEPAITKAPVEQSFLDKAGEFVMNNKMNIALGGLGLAQMMPPSSGVNPISESMIRPYTYSEEDTSDQEADPRGREKIRYSSSYAAGTPYKAAQGGLLSLHRGGNFLSGRGDGMSDDIPAMIGTKQPARLADGEFVIPADVVSHIGNGSSKAGAEKLYAMMDKIRQERTGRKRQSPQINAAKYLPR